MTIGDPLSYLLTVRNAGPDPAALVMVSDSLPASVTPSSATPSVGSCMISGQTIECPLGNMAVGAKATITIEATPTEAGTVENTAQMGTETDDPNTANNGDLEQTSVTEAGSSSADVALTKTDSQDPIQVGEAFSYTLAATNQGPGEATDVQVSDSVPVGLTVESVVPDQGACMTAGGVVTCELGALAEGASAGVEILVVAEETGSTFNSASIGAQQSDPQPGNNSAAESTQVFGEGQDAIVIPSMNQPRRLLLILTLLPMGAYMLKGRSQAA